MLRVGLVLLLALVFATGARAEERVAVSFGPGVEPELAAQLRIAIAGQLADLVRVEWDGSEAACAVDVSRDREALVVTVSSPRGRALRRLAAEDDALAAGEVASVVRAYVIALREPPRGWGWSASALYTGNAYAPQLAWQSGVRVELAVSYRWLHVGVGYGYHPPVRVRHPLATIRVRDHGVYTVLGAESGGARWRVGGDILAGVTGTLRSTDATPFVLTEDARHWSPALALRLRGRLRVLGRLWLELMPVLELTLGRPAYEVDFVSQARVLSPRMLQGRLDVGASFGSR